MPGIIDNIYQFQVKNKLIFSENNIFSIRNFTLGNIVLFLLSSDNQPQKKLSVQLFIPQRVEIYLREIECDTCFGKLFFFPFHSLFI